MTNDNKPVATGIESQTPRVPQNTRQLPQQPLEPISPSEAIEMYLSDRERELRTSSLRAHESALNFFEKWCDKRGIENLNDLTGRLLHQFRIWRREEATTKVDKLSKKSEKDQQDIIRAFTRYCESIEAVRPGLHEKVLSPTIPRDEAARDDRLNSERASEILDYLRTYEYASTDHALWELLTDHGPRTGAVHSADKDDYHPDEDTPYIAYRHRPEAGTELKKADQGERLVAISESLQKVLDEHLENQRPDVTDEYGREPLLASKHGRLAKSTIRKYVYKWTRPCAIGKICPYNRDEETCKASPPSAASKCPSSLSPHAVRRGYITHELTAGLDRSYVSERCNVSEEIIKLHYDDRDEHERLEVRQLALEKARQEKTEYGGDR